MTNNQGTHNNLVSTNQEQVITQTQTQKEDDKAFEDKLLDYLGVNDKKAHAIRKRESEEDH